MSDERAIRTIAIVGGGIVALSAATAFARALPRARVTLAETRVAPEAYADRLPIGGPGIHRFHASIGVAEQELIRSRAAAHHLGTLFEDWPGAWAHAFGAHGLPVGGIHFDQIWLRARAADKALPYERYSIASALARAGKFVHPDPSAKSLASQFGYGLRLDPDLYREMLRVRATAAQVQILRGELVGTERRDRGGLAAVQLSGGQRLEADLFVDCTGPSALLLSPCEDSLEEWSAWLPFRAVELSERPAAEVPPTAAIARADDHGWSGEWPLHGRTLTLRATIGSGGARGRRLRPWFDNVLAIGDAMAPLDPLHALGLELAHQTTLLALELLPGRDMNPLEIREYNRRAEQLTRRIRDFLLLHYLRSGRTSDVWAEAAQSEPPDSLARTLDQYSHRGRLPFHEEESITRDSWTAALIATGNAPRNVDPQALSVPLDPALGAMQRLARDIDETVAQLPAYADYLARITR